MNLKIIERAGWKSECMACHSPFLWTKINLMNGLEPYLYCAKRGDILLRQSDLERLFEVARDNGKREPSAEQLQGIWTEMETAAPSCRCGADFSSTARPRCPKCGHELLTGGRDELIHANWIMVLDDAIVVKDSIEASYQVRVTFTPPQT